MTVTTDTLTHVDAYDGWWAKREDRAGYAGADLPSGAKVRQFAAMIDAAPAGAPLVVACSADSAMQVYVGAAARTTGRRAIVVVGQRKQRSASTEWAAAHGVEIVEHFPAYLSVIRQVARGIAADLGGAVRWDPALAARDTAEQVANVPPDTRRIVIPSGSGLTAAGVAAGLAHARRGRVEVVAVAVSTMTTEAKIRDLVDRHHPDLDGLIPPIRVVTHPMPYQAPLHGRTLPDGTPLDPHYAAKAIDYVDAGDVLWVVGRRP